MKITQIAAQLYTVRDHCKTAADLAVTARKLKRIGYTAVQVSGVGPISEEDLVAILGGEGLVICATHEPGNIILEDPERVIDRLRKLNCKLTAYPFPHGVDFTSIDQVKALATKLDRSGARLREAGLTLGYHNHAIEFVQSQGQTGLSWIYSLTDPQYLVSELDTYWVHYGGGDVCTWVDRLQGRLPFIHLKDYCFTPANLPTYCEIGAGTLPFDRLIPKATAAGCEWFIVEQDVCPGDPFASLAKSFDYLREHFVSSL